MLYTRYIYRFCYNNNNNTIFFCISKICNKTYIVTTSKATSNKSFTYFCEILLLYFYTKKKLLYVKLLDSISLPGALSTSYKTHALTI